jgi:DeoR-like helix-turn-helix domain
MADFVTRCRSGVVRDGYRRELEYAPEPEMPARLAKQLFELLRGVALVCGHEEATQEDYDRIARVALDCIPAARRTVLRTIATLTAMEAGALTTTQVAQTVQYSTAAVRRALEDLQALGILHVTKGGQGVADQWRPRQEWHEALDTLKKVESAVETRRKATFSEKLEEGRTHNIEEATPNGADDDAAPRMRGSRNPASNNGCGGVADRGVEKGEGETNKGLHAGDWCYLLSADGIQQNAEPYLIASLETGPDGQQYARFLERDMGWPLAQCERADPPTPIGPPDNLEEF